MESNKRGGSQQQQKRRLTLFPLLSLLIFTSIFLLLSISRKPSLSSSKPSNHVFFPPYRSNACNYSNGHWIHDSNFRPRYDSTCKEIFKGWNCLLNNKPNAADIPNWRWRSDSCLLPPLDPLRFLRSFANTNIGIDFFAFSISCVCNWVLMSN